MLRLLGGILTLLTTTGVVAHELLVLNASGKNILRYSAERVPVPATNPPLWTHVLIDTFATITTSVPQDTPQRMAYHPDGRLFVTIGSQVQIRDGVTGEFLNQFSIGQEAVGLAFGTDGHVFIADGSQAGGARHRVVEHDANGEFIRQFTPEGDGLVEPTEMVFGPSGDLYVASRQSGVRRYQSGTGYYMGYFIPPSGNAVALEHDPANARLYVYHQEGSVTEHEFESGEFLRRVVIEQSSGQGMLLVPEGCLYAGTLYMCAGGVRAFDTDLPHETAFPVGQTGLPAFGTAQDIVFATRAVTDASGQDVQAPTLSLRRDGRRIHISYLLPEAAPTRLSVFDVRGRRVQLIEFGSRTAGEHTSTWDLDRGLGPAPAGVYFVELRAAKHRAAARVVVR